MRAVYAKLIINLAWPKGPFIAQKLYSNLIDQFHQNAFEKIGKKDSKLRTYAMIKTETGMEEYLTEIRNVTLRTQVAKLRISNHKLRIETGRHQGLDSDQRFCPFCATEIECEIHFLIECPIYKHLRMTLYDEMITLNPCFPYLSRMEKFVFILTNSTNIEVASFIHKSFEIREFLLMPPRSID